MKFVFSLVLSFPNFLDHPFLIYYCLLSVRNLSLRTSEECQNLNHPLPSTLHETFPLVGLQKAIPTTCLFKTAMNVI